MEVEDRQERNVAATALPLLHGARPQPGVALRGPSLASPEPAPIPSLPDAVMPAAILPAAALAAEDAALDPRALPAARPRPMRRSISAPTIAAC